MTNIEYVKDLKRRIMETASKATDEELVGLYKEAHNILESNQFTAEEKEHIRQFGVLESLVMMMPHELYMKLRNEKITKI